MSAGPMVHARERSALAESWPDPQPTVPTLRCCRQNSKNQLVHTSRVLLSHGARLVHRNLHEIQSSRSTATDMSTSMTNGSRRAPPPGLFLHPACALALACRFARNGRETLALTARLDESLTGPFEAAGVEGAGLSCLAVSIDLECFKKAHRKLHRTTSERTGAHVTC